MQHIPRRTRASAAVAMAVAGLACIAAGAAPHTASRAVRAAVHLPSGPAAVAAGISPLILGARVATRALHGPPRPGGGR